MPALLACAACTTVYVDPTNNDACSEYVPSSMWERTPHAAPPSASQAGHVNFEIEEAGQLEKANDKPPAIQHIITTCERKKKEATERAKHKLEPWWKHIF